MTFHNLMGYIMSISKCLQNFITIFQTVQEIRPFSLFQNLTLCKASTDDKCHFTIVSLWSESEPQQKLTQSQMPFDNLIGKILSISVCMQNFITIFHSVQEIAPLSLFQNLELGKASTSEKCHLAISWARSSKYQCLCNSLSNYSTQFKRYDHFHFFRIWCWAKPRPMKNVILQFLELDLVNINVSAKFNQNIPNALRVKFHCFQNLNLGKTSTNPKRHLTISWATSCQYQCVCKISSQYSTQFKR